MENESKLFFDNLKDRTGMEFSVYDKDGVLVYGFLVENELIPTGSYIMLSDKENNRTLVRLNVKNENYTLRINGAGRGEEVCAKLILELAEKTFAKPSVLTREEFLRALLLGELSIIDIGRYVKKYSVKDGLCCVMLVCTDKNVADAMSVVNAFSPDGKDYLVMIDQKSFAIVKYIESSSVADYRSFTEYAEYIVQSVFDELGLNVLVSMGGTVKSITDVSVSFSQAVTAHRMAEASNLTTGVHTFKEYIFYRILEDLPRYKLNEYMNLLNDSVSEEIFTDKEMIETAEEFLNNSLNQSETARELFLHRNTLNYRLDKMEKATGLNLRRFSDAVTFRLITTIRQLVK